MKPPAFQYFRPKTIAESLTLLNTVPDAKILAGGQSLVPLMNMRLARPQALIDINGVEELRDIREEGTYIKAGALVRHYQLEQSSIIREGAPLVSQAEKYIGHEAIRSRGTIGGSLCHADPAAELPLLAVLQDWEMIAQSSQGTRIIPARDFFLTYFLTALAPDELLTAIRIPRQREDGSIAEYSIRHGDFALASAAVLVNTALNGELNSIAVSVGGVSEVPWRDVSMEQQWIGQPAAKALWRDIAHQVAFALDPPEDVHASGEQRRHLAETLIVEALESAVTHNSSSIAGGQ